MSRNSVLLTDRLSGDQILVNWDNVAYAKRIAGRTDHTVIMFTGLNDSQAPTVDVRESPADIHTRL